MISRALAGTLMSAALLAGSTVWAAEGTSSERIPGSRIAPASEIVKYPDHRPSARYRLEAKDQGVVFRHGTGPGRCDYLGARDVWVYESDGTYYMHYDGAGPKGWLCCLATSKDLLTWTPKGPVLDFGAKGEEDSASASYGVTYFDGQVWHRSRVHRCGLGLLDQGSEPLECGAQGGGARRPELHLEPQVHRPARGGEGA